MVTTTANEAVSYTAQRYAFYWTSFTMSYLFPLTYFGIKLGVTQEATKSISMPLVLIAFFGIIKLATDIPGWVSAWKPGFWKGMIRAIPMIALFIVLITFGLVLKYLIDNQVGLPFAAYFESVLVLFGGMSTGSVLGAFHLKYKELDYISKGYVLGVVNK